jgi:hypothetical protein
MNEEDEDEDEDGGRGQHTRRERERVWQQLSQMAGTGLQLSVLGCLSVNVATKALRRLQVKS